MACGYFCGVFGPASTVSTVSDPGVEPVLLHHVRAVLLHRALRRLLHAEHHVH